MMDGRAGHGHGLARGGIFVEFLDGVGRPSGRSVYGASRVVETGSAYGVNCRIGVDTSTRISAPRRASPTNCRASPDQNLPGS
jgi:hypothetical protein